MRPPPSSAALARTIPPLVTVHERPKAICSRVGDGKRDNNLLKQASPLTHFFCR